MTLTTTVVFTGSVQMTLETRPPADCNHRLILPAALDALLSDRVLIVATESSDQTALPQLSFSDVALNLKLKTCGAVPQVSVAFFNFKC